MCLVEVRLVFLCFHRFSLYFCALLCYSDHFGFVSLVSFAGFGVIPVASRAERLAGRNVSEMTMTHSVSSGT